jgi:F-type H+-transporting ATPase subunit b
MEQLGINLPGLITQIVSFVILFAILSKLLYKPLVNLLDQRAEKITAGLEAAERAKEEASKSEDSIRIQLEEARSEGQRLIAQARETAEKLREEEIIKVKGEIEAERVRAQTNIERERDAAIEELRREFGGLAISAAEKVVKSTLDEEKNRELISSVLEENTVSK